MALLLAMIVADSDSDDDDDSGVSLCFYWSYYCCTYNLKDSRGYANDNVLSYRSSYAWAIKNYPILIEFTSKDCKQIQHSRNWDLYL